jgi:hypothetical protein
MGAAKSRDEGGQHAPCAGSVLLRHLAEPAERCRCDSYGPCQRHRYTDDRVDLLHIHKVIGALEADRRSLATLRCGGLPLPYQVGP